jgi:hypothetical protein
MLRVTMLKWSAASAAAVAMTQGVSLTVVTSMSKSISLGASRGHSSVLAGRRFGGK